MSNKTPVKPLSVALGAAFVTSLAGTTVASAADNPFGMTRLSSAYTVAESGEEGKCGGTKSTQGMTGKEGTADKAGMKATEGKCGEGKCGAKREAHEGKCGGTTKPQEGESGGDM